LDDAKVDVENVPFDETAGARYTVAYDVVQGNAGGFRETSIIQRRRDGGICHDKIVAKLVERFRRDTGPDMLRDHVEGQCSQPPSGAHAGKVLAGMDHNVTSIGGRIHVYSNP
jgi:hypothetical protein